MNNPPVFQPAEKIDLKSIQCEFESHRGDHPFYKLPIWKIYGPYQNRKDLRRRVMAYDRIQKITISYPKFMMECILKRLLTENEEVHHKNGIEFDDRIENFEIKLGTIHRQEHRTKLPEYFICPTCKILFSLEKSRLTNYKSNLKRKSWLKGPYCSRSCNGKVNN